MSAPLGTGDVIEEDDVDDLAKRFEHHPPSSDAIVDAHQQVRGACAFVADVITALAPPSREQSLALTKVEEAMFWANAAIARNQG